MLGVSQLTVEFGYGRTRTTAVDAVSFEIPNGATLALVGESGSGKTTVARAIVGLVVASRGEIGLDGEKIAATSGRRGTAFRRRVQLVFQDPFASLNPRMTIGAALTEAIGIGRSVDRSARNAKAQRLLEVVRLPQDALYRFPHELSGGQRQRVAIARALAVDPEVLVMDEVTSSLDVAVQAAILNLLKDLQNQLGLTYLFITHNLAVVPTMSDQVAVMHAGRIVEISGTRELMATPQHRYTKELLGSIPGRTAVADETASARVDNSPVSN